MKVSLPIDAAVSTEVTIDIEWGDATTAALVAALDQSARYKLEAALSEVDQADHHETILDEVRATLARETSEAQSAAVGVVFTTDEWDNGRFYDTESTVYFADGSQDTFDFDGLSDTFSDMGIRHSRSSLSVDLRTGKIEEHDIVVEARQFGVTVAVAK